jgi:hypothetical protein
MITHPHGNGRMIILLPCGRETIIDATAAAIIAPYRWYAAQQSSGDHYARGERHRGDPRVYMHRILLPSPPGVLVDHRDGFGLHNWGTNLRRATVAKNNQNVAKRSRKKPFKGVFTTDSGRFFAAIQADGARYYDRGHTSAEDAAAAYDVLARKHHGEFARLNFPPSQAVGGVA